jgi:hypothetical protein
VRTFAHKRVCGAEQIDDPGLDTSIIFSGANGPCCVTTPQVVPIFPRPVTSLNQFLPCVADRLGYEPISGTCTHGQRRPPPRSSPHEPTGALILSTTSVFFFEGTCHLELVRQLLQARPARNNQTNIPLGWFKQGTSTHTHHVRGELETQRIMAARSSEGRPA